MKNNLVSIGKIRKTLGLDGSLLAAIVLDNPDILQEQEYVFIGSEKAEPEKYHIETVETVFRGTIFNFAGISSRSDADELVNKEVYIDRKLLSELDEWTFYNFQLIDMTVNTVDGNHVGKISDVMETGANDVYRITMENGKDVLIPALRSIIVSVDLDSGIMVIDPMENMLDV